ncbi:MAG: serine hydrolase [Pseudomonadota bacterium]
MARAGLLLLFLVTVLGAALTGYVINAGPVGAALIAKQLCSLHYISGLDPHRARKLYIESLIGPGDRLFSHEIDTQQRAVHVRGAGRSARAYHHAGLGCVLDTPAAPLTETVTINRAPAEAVDYGHRRQHFDQQALEAALDQAFAEPEGTAARRNTLAIAVRHRGRLIAERYAPGVAPETPLPGWSMAKSFTATLAGMLVHEGRLDLEATELFPGWRTPDPRARITPDHLLRMLSGIDIEENGSGLDANSRMLFTEPSALAYAIARPLRAEPGSTFAYTSGSTILLQGLLTHLSGGSEAMQQRVRDLLDRLGMHHSIFEPDPRGLFVGSSFLFASARDWTRLGQLYLNEGRWDGAQLFAPDWVRYAATPSEQSADRSYGAGFWGARPAHVYAPHGVPPPPADTLAAHGLQNQALYIIPSAELTVARLGATRGYWQSGEWDLVQDLLAARLQRAGADS